MDMGIPSITFLVIGYLGLLSFVLSYALLQFSIIPGSGLTYTLLNLSAATLLMVSHIHSFNMTALITQSIWATLSLVGIGRILMQRRGLHFSDEETALYDEVFSALPLPMVRRLFDAGTWTSMKPGTELLREGSSVAQLYALISGEAEAKVGSVSVGHISHGLIGEINVLSGSEASATVQITEPSRIFVISGPVLRKMVQRDRDLGLALQQALHRETGRKLVALNLSKSVE